MASPTRRPLTAEDHERYWWMLDKIRSVVVSGDGIRIFDLQLALPPAKSLEESIDLARWPFTTGNAITACSVKVGRNKWTSRTTACEPVELAVLPEVRFGVHKEPGHRFNWQVTEFSTGALVVRKAASRESAIEKLQDLVRKFGPEYFKRLVADFRERAYQRQERARSEG